MSGNSTRPDPARIDTELNVLLDDLTRDAHHPERADARLIDVFGNDDGAQLVFQISDPFIYAHHYELLDAWALCARRGERRWMISLARRHEHHQAAIATLDGMLERVEARRSRQ